MARAKRIAHAKDTVTGETVLEMFVPRAENDGVSVGLRLLTQQLSASGHGDGSGMGMFGGEYGYGVKHDNDVFMMHPFCWCERDDCFWCGGSCGCGEPYVIGHYLDGARVTDAEYEAWQKAIEKPLPWEATTAKHGTPEYRKHQRAFDRYIKSRNARSGSIWPAVVHTCGHGMFYSRAEEIWSVYSPQPYPHSAPHFWHKPSGLRVWWYKYIGRDQIVSIDRETPLADVLSECLRSIGVESLEAAAKEYAAAEARAAEQSRKAMEFAFSDEGRKMFDAMVSAGVVHTFEFGNSDDGNGTEH